VLSRYILDIETAEEMEEYVGDMLQGTDGKKRHFIDELLVRWQRTKRRVTDSPAPFLPREAGVGDGEQHAGIILNLFTASNHVYIGHYDGQCHECFHVN